MAKAKAGLDTTKLAAMPLKIWENGINLKIKIPDM